MLPPDIPNLFAWHRPESLAGTADGAEVTRWPDEGPHGYHMTDAAFATEPNPRYVASAVNGQPGLRWPDAALGHVRYPEYGENAQPVAFEAMTALMVTLPSATGFSDVELWCQSFAGKHAGVGPSGLEIYRYDDDLTRGLNSVFVRGHTGGTTGPRVEVNQRVAHRNAGITTVVRTSGLRADFNCDILATPASSLTTGWASEWYAYGEANAVICEIVAYTRALTDAEIRQVRCYLSDKYGLRLPCCVVPPLRGFARDDRIRGLGSGGRPTSRQESIRGFSSYV